MEKKKVMQGNIATAVAAVRAGCRFFCGYPITPQTSITEYLSTRMCEVGGEFVQAESEVAAINMLMGASAGGLRAMTATAGPGLSLMAEGMSCMAAGRYPGVIVDVQRGGGGSGTITASQSDYNFVTKTLGHGGLRAFVLAPMSVQEVADFTFRAFDIADKYRNPVIVLSDAVIGQMMEPVALPEFKKELPDKSDWIANGCEGRERRVVRDYDLGNRELLEKRYIAANDMYEKWQQEEVVWENIQMDDAEIVILAFGTAARIAKSVVTKLRKEGHKVGIIRPVTLFPFPYDVISKLDNKTVKAVLVVEMAIPAQLYYDVKLALDRKIPLHSATRCGGIVITPEEIEAALRKIM